MTNLLPYKSPEGLEILIDNKTGEVFANAKAIARMCSTADRKVDHTMIRSYGETLVQRGEISEPKTAEIGTTKGKRIGKLYDETAIVEFVSEYNPALLKAFTKAGARMYLYGIAGYKPPTRARLTAEEIIELCCLPTPTIWQRRFPQEYYEHLSRLTGLSTSGHLRPGYFGQLTKELVYDYLPVGIYDEIKRCKAETGSWERLHQFLSDEGVAILETHQKRVLEHMQGAANLDQLQTSLRQACTGQYQLVLL